MKKSEFADLHLHSTYSFLDGYGTLQQIVDRAKELGRPVLALTDHGNVSGFCDFEKAIKGTDIKPIYGCEFYCSDELGKRERHHLTVLAKDIKGYQSVLNLATIAWGHTYYGYPVLLYDELFENAKHVVVLSGCTSGIIPRMIVADDMVSAEDWALKMRNRFGEDFFLEIQPFDLDDVRKVCVGIDQISKKLDISIVSTSDVHYPRPIDAAARNILRAASLRTTVDKLDASAPLHQREANELVSEYKALYGDSINWKSGIHSIPLIASKCEKYALPKANMLKIGENTEKRITELCMIGMKAKGFANKAEYKKRLERELSLISEKKFFDYFYVVYDMVNWAKNNGVFVGPSRGSSAGSLVCYLLGITEVDPIGYGLLFERFIDETRTDYPDIDVDFDSDSRNSVIQYLKGKYGDNNVALVGSFAEFKGKNSIDEVRRVFLLSQSGANRIKHFLLERSIADARASFTIEDTMNKFPQVKRVIDKEPKFMNAKLIEGQMRHVSTHAAGVLVSQDDLGGIISLYTKKGDRISSCDKGGAEYLNLLKIDVLALKTLNIVKRVCDRVGLVYNDLLALPLDDEKTFEGFLTGDIRGVFQFDGEATSSITGPVAPSTIKDLVDIVALSKPGPLHSRSTKAYIDIRSGKKKMPKEVHPLLTKLTADTYGQVLFQEQVMSIVREIGEFNWADTNKIRKAMAKSMGQEFMAGFEEKFITGASHQGLSAAASREIWKHICTHGSWSFNKSHAAGYALLGYWQMYLKKHYPLEFYWATILEEADERKRHILLIDLMEKGYKLYPPNVNHSKKNWGISKKKDGLVAGLGEVPGIGPKTAEAIEQYQPYKDFDDMQAKCTKRVVNSKIQKIVEEYNMFDVVNSDEMTVVKLWKQLQHPSATVKIGKLRWMEEEKKNMIFCCFMKSKMLYNHIEEDSIRGMQKNYSEPDKTDYLIITLEDATGQIKGEVDRFVYADNKNKLWDLDDVTPILVLCDMPAGRRYITVKKIKMLGKGKKHGEAGRAEESDGDTAESGGAAED